MVDPSPAQRRRAAGLAGHLGDEPRSRQALHDSETAVRIAGLRSLARLSCLDDPTLADALTDPDPAMRVAALELAAGRPSPPITALLDDPDPSVVEMAAWACGERGATASVVDLLTALCGTHHDPLVREAAVAALGAIGDRDGLAAILAAMADKPAIRRRAVVALAAFDDPEVDAAWHRARSDRDRQVRDAVDELLGPTLSDTDTDTDTEG